MNSNYTNCTCSTGIVPSQNESANRNEDLGSVAEVILCDASRMALLSHIPDLMNLIQSAHEQRNAAMLDNPEKTARLIVAITTALPFEVELTSSTIAYLRAQHIAGDVKPMQTVSKVSYAGDEGGILCHLEPEDTENVIIVSLTHVRIHRSLACRSRVRLPEASGEEIEKARQRVSERPVCAIGATSRAV